MQVQGTLMAPGGLARSLEMGKLPDAAAAAAAAAALSPAACASTSVLELESLSADQAEQLD